MSSAAKRGILYTILALALMGFCWVSGRAAGVDSVTLRDAETVLAGHSGYLRAIDSLKGVEAHYVGLEGYYRRLADSLGRFHAANPVGVQVSANPSGSSPQGANSRPVADSLRVVFLGRALDACDASRGAADSALARCRLRGDSLETSLRAVLAVKSCRVFGFIPCPSRGAFFVLGAVGGALLEHRLTH